MTGATCGAEETAWTWILGLNASRFAGYTDWRVPTIDELTTTLNYAAPVSPHVDSMFHTSACEEGCTNIYSDDCSCTLFYPPYWSRSFDTSGTAQGHVLLMDYWLPEEAISLDYHFSAIRAVRGGQ
jgi:hypothetical protein